MSDPLNSEWSLLDHGIKIYQIDPKKEYIAVSPKKLVSETEAIKLIKMFPAIKLVWNGELEPVELDAKARAFLVKTIFNIKEDEADREQKPI